MHFLIGDITHSVKVCKTVWEQYVINNYVIICNVISLGHNTEEFMTL